MEDNFISNSSGWEWFKLLSSFIEDLVTMFNNKFHFISIHPHTPSKQDWINIDLVQDFHNKLFAIMG